jgi:hypothetical protein
MRWPERTPTDRLFAHLVVPENPSDCWEWTGLTNAQGYGRIFFDGHYHVAHRVSWVLHYGPIPEGLCVLHTCDQPRCCSPVHLWLGTKGDNNRDREAKGRGRQSQGEQQGAAKLTEAQVREIRASAGYRMGCKLARQYGISYSQMNRILRGESWAHVSAT